MPLVTNSNYKRPVILFNPHLETIVPSVFRKISGPLYQRERIHLFDGDFLDIDWLKSGYKKLVIISHGLEGNSERHYVKGMAAYFFSHHWDVAAWNCRGCSGEINLAPRLYHHAGTEDLEAVIQHALNIKQYSKIALIGFSMGGSLTLKYLGERKEVPQQIVSSTVFSVPCNLGDSAALLDQNKNKFYRNRFLRKLKRKINLKSAQYPHVFDTKPLEKINYFREFDEIYTAPTHGFKSAEHFYQKASASLYIPNINIPSLLVNAQNDPFLSETCYPISLAKDHPHFFLEIPQEGGHVGFNQFGKKQNYMEYRALNFIEQYA